MAFSNDFLHALTNEEVQGDFPPFSSGKEEEAEAYVRRLVGRLRDDYRLIMEPDFNHYGSGYASYVPVRVRHRDGSDDRLSTKGLHVTTETSGLLIYICRLAPYWFYGGSKWSETLRDGRFHGGSGSFLEPESAAALDAAHWADGLRRMTALFEEFGYGLLSVETLVRPAPADAVIATVLADRPYKVFDCFFYWAD